MFQNIKLSKENRVKLIFTILILFALRIGYVLPLPFIDRSYMSGLMERSQAFGFLNILNGNSFENMSLFALSITPYITASIIMQLLAVVIPSIGEMAKGGKSEREKYERWMYGAGIILAFIQALAISFSFGRQGMFIEFKWYYVVIATLIWTAGAAFLMWIGKKITDKLIGNGISLILLFNILASIPRDVRTIGTMIANGKSVPMIILLSVIVIAAVVALIAYLVVYEKAERRIPITYSGIINKSRFRMNQTSNLPLRLNMTGVLPIIFTSTIISIPSMIGQFFTIDYSTWYGKLILFFSPSAWFSLNQWYYSFGAILYIALTYMFMFFYIAISINPREMSDNLKKNGGVIPGLRPGESTTKALTREIYTTAFIGNTMLLLAILAIMIVSGLTGVGSLSFSGTSIVIIVAVILEFYRTLESLSGVTMAKMGGLFGKEDKNVKVS